MNSLNITITKTYNKPWVAKVQPPEHAIQDAFELQHEHPLVLFKLVLFALLKSGSATRTAKQAIATARGSS